MVASVVVDAPNSANFLFVQSSNFRIKLFGNYQMTFSDAVAEVPLAPAILQSKWIVAFRELFTHSQHDSPAIPLFITCVTGPEKRSVLRSRTHLVYKELVSRPSHPMRPALANTIKGNPLKTFQEMNLIEPLLRAIADENYETPTPIQAQTIPAAIEGRDILGCAQTGTGKTAAFALPILNRLGQDNRRPTPNKPLALVLAPTRELAIQIGESFATYGKHLRVKHALVYGGVNQNSQVRALDRGVHVLVATPGRLLDLMNQGYIKLDGLEVFVLDEADRMMDMGFLPDLKRIIKMLPRQRQSVFYSATLPPNIIQLARQLVTDPVSVNVTPKTTSVKMIEQKVMFVEKSGKTDLLCKTLSGADVERSIVFTRTKRGANQVAKQLVQNGFSATAIHGNKSQNARQRALDAFRGNKVKVLVATDVAARGIDIDGVTHVFNYDMPVEPEAYVHRIGRTGRAGAAGIAVSFCSNAERSDLHAIERLIGDRIPGDRERRGAEPQDQPTSRPRGGSRSSGGRSSGRPASGTRSSGRRSTGSHSAGSRSAASPVATSRTERPTRTVTSNRSRTPGSTSASGHSGSAPTRSTRRPRRKATLSRSRG